MISKFGMLFAGSVPDKAESNNSPDHSDSEYFELRHKERAMYQMYLDCMHTLEFIRQMEKRNLLRENKNDIVK